MLNNIFINENSPNPSKLSARAKQADPTMALDQASSFAGALANQVSINQNNSSNTSYKPNNGNQTPNQTNNTNSNTTQKTTNTAKSSETNTNNNVKADNSTNKTDNNAKTDNKTLQSDKQNKNLADNQNSINAAKTTKPNKLQANKSTLNQNIELARNLVTSDINKNLNKAGALNPKGFNHKALPENFQKIIANLQGRHDRPTLSNINPKGDTEIKTNLDKDGLSTGNKKLNLHQSQLKTKLRTIDSNTKDTHTNNKLKSAQDTIRLEQRNAPLFNDKIIAAGQAKELINNHLAQGIDRHSDIENNTLNNNPIFGLTSVNTTSIPTANANLQHGLIPSHINNPQWGNDLSRQLSSMIRTAENGTQIAELRLDPPQLGPLRVTINLNDGIVNAVFSSMHANVRNAIEQSLPQLQQQLQQEGLSLGQADVGQDHQDHQQTYSQDNNQGNTLLTQNQDSTNIDNNTIQNNNRATDPNALLDTYV